MRGRYGMGEVRVACLLRGRYFIWKGILPRSADNADICLPNARAFQELRATSPIRLREPRRSRHAATAERTIQRRRTGFAAGAHRRPRQAANVRALSRTYADCGRRDAARCRRDFRSDVRELELRRGVVPLQAPDHGRRDRRRVVSRGPVSGAHVRQCRRPGAAVSIMQLRCRALERGARARRQCGRSAALHRRARAGRAASRVPHDAESLVPGRVPHRPAVRALASAAHVSPPSPRYALRVLRGREQPQS